MKKLLILSVFLFASNWGLPVIVNTVSVSYAQEEPAPKPEPKPKPEPEFLGQ